MIALLMVLFLLVSFGLVVAVLLQAGKGGGLAAGFGGSGTGFEFLGGRQTATFLHLATRWLGGAFLAIAFLIALLTARGNRPGSLLERQLPGAPQPVEQQSGTPQSLDSVLRSGETLPAGAEAAPTSSPAGAPGAAPAAPQAPPPNP